MANWQRKLYLTDLWNKYEDGEMTIQRVAAETVDRVKAIEPIGIDWIDEKQAVIIEQFEEMEHDSELTLDEFNYGGMQDLYNWGDISLDDRFNGKKVCWIQTF